MNRSYSELIEISTFENRFEYLKLSGSIGENTFGPMRFINQDFYTSTSWRRFRRNMIIRDCGCDLAISGLEIQGRIIIVHHINPITHRMILNNSSLLVDPNNVICCSENTHKAIHYGDLDLFIIPPVCIERKINDTVLW